jgi:hypothetical protein
MADSRSGVTVSFRDADEPRPLAARLIAVAHRHTRGWTVTTADGHRVEAATFDSAAGVVMAATGVERLLLVWTTAAAW